MAEDDIGNIVGQYLNISTFNDVLGIIVLMVLLVIGAAVLFYFLYISQFKTKFRLKVKNRSSQIIIDTKARQIKDRDGVIWWQLLYKKLKVQVPPSDAIELDARGVRCVEAYLLPSEEVIYAIDRARVPELPDSIISIKDKEERKKKIEEWKEKNEIPEFIEPFIPFTSTDRAILANQVIKAQEKRSKPWQDYIMPLAAIGAVVIIVVSLMIFYEDMGKPLLEMADKQIAYQSQITQQMDLMREMSNDIQILKDEVGVNNAAVPN